MHLGHLKAYWANRLLTGPKADDLEDTRTAILDGHLTLLNYALRFGYSYQIWKTVVNTMLEKDVGTPKIHCLKLSTYMKRTIISYLQLNDTPFFTMHAPREW